MGLSNFYEITQNVIRGSNGTEFTFHGLKHNISNIKSVEGTDICWVEEAADVSYDSWKTLIPTIRKESSEIWISFNPELDTDETYNRFVIRPPTESTVIKMNWSDNPWFPEVLKKEKDELKERDPDAYLTVWEGHCQQTLSGAVYVNEIRKAVEENRICRIPYDKTKGVHVFADLGWSDNTSLWFVQRVGMDYRVLLSYQNRLRPWSHYLEIIQKTNYLIDTIWLPHDGANDDIKGKSIEKVTKDTGKKVRVIPRTPVKMGLDAAREIFPFCYFDEEGTKEGMQALKRYVWEDTSTGQSTREPKHDENSHYADAFRYFAVGFKEAKPVDEYAKALTRKLSRKVDHNVPMRSDGWMG
jgi:phage terminase large subunit